MHYIQVLSQSTGQWIENLDRLPPGSRYCKIILLINDICHEIVSGDPITAEHYLILQSL